MTHRYFRGAIALGLVLSAMALLPMASAHHVSLSSNVPAPDRTYDSAGFDAREVAPRLELGISYGYALFDRALRGQVAYASEQLGQISLHTLMPELSVRVFSGTRLGLVAPVGAVTTRTSNGARESKLSPSDLQLRVAQDLVASPPSTRAGGLRLGTNFTLVLPTGSYDRNRVFSTTAATTTAETSTTIVTYDTRASLGTGVVSAAASLQLVGQLAPTWEMSSHASVSVPLTDAPDGIRWGRDFQYYILSSWRFLSGWPRLLTGTAYRFHGVDRIPFENARRRSGGRMSLDARGGVSLDFSDQRRCSVTGQLPVWQRVDGIQLVETLSLNAGCSIPINL